MHDGGLFVVFDELDSHPLVMIKCLDFKEKKI